MLKKLFLFINLLIVLSLFSCGNKTSHIKDGESSSIDTSAVQDSLTKEIQYKYDYVISNIPVPFEALDKLFQSDIPYNQQFLNSAANIDKYVQNNSKALNLGIYGADLAYVVSFEQFKEMSPYLKSAKEIADDLGIPLAFNKETLDRYDANRNNKDSLENIIYGSYREVDRSLKSNERIGLATLVVTGGWLESIYITTQTLNNGLGKAAQKEVHKVIKQQQFHLNNIIKLLNDFSEDAYFENLLNDLNSIKTALNSFSNAKEDNDQQENSLLLEKVKAVRNTIVEGLYTSHN